MKSGRVSVDDLLKEYEDPATYHAQKIADRYAEHYGDAQDAPGSVSTAEAMERMLLECGFVEASKVREALPGVSTEEWRTAREEIGAQMVESHGVWWLVWPRATAAL